MKRERSANLRQDRCCEAEPQTDATGESWEGVCGEDAESEDLPASVIGFFGLKNDMILQKYWAVFKQDMIGRRSQSVLFFAVLSYGARREIPLRPEELHALRRSCGWAPQLLRIEDRFAPEIFEPVQSHYQN